MQEIKSKEIHYHSVKNGQSIEERSYSFQYLAVPNLPNGSSNKEILERAIQVCRNPALKNVVTDLYRYLFFSNFARPRKPTNSNWNPAFEKLESNYPYCGVIQWAQDSESGKPHPSGKTDTLGAVLYLILYSKNSEETDRLVKGVFVAMLNHKKFNKLGVTPIPVVDTAILNKSTKAI